jgi:hypothetical protein
MRSVSFLIAPALEVGDVNPSQKENINRTKDIPMFNINFFILDVIILSNLEILAPVKISRSYFISIALEYLNDVYERYP